MTMKEHMQVQYDKQSDVLEIRIGNPGKSKYVDLEDGIFQRIDEKTKETKGISIFTFKQRMETGNAITLPVNFKIKVEK